MSRRKKKASMSFATALGLSFSNLLTKKARTILVSFAGSIGIIGNLTFIPDFYDKKYFSSG